MATEVNRLEIKQLPMPGRYLMLNGILNRLPRELELGRRRGRSRGAGPIWPSHFFSRYHCASAGKACKASSTAWIT